MIYKIRFTKQALKDIKVLPKKFARKLKGIFEDVLSMDPYSGKKLVGDFKGCYSYRTNIKDRIVYTIDEKKKRVVVKRARTRYGD